MWFARAVGVVARKSADDGTLWVLLRVEEAARPLRVGRSHAYNQTTLHFETGALEGTSALRIGDVIRVPKHALHESITTGRCDPLSGVRSATRSSIAPWPTAR